jgi:hypothetical protein
MPHHKPLPSRDWLLENLRYEPETGLFWWVKRGKNRKITEPVGTQRYVAKTGKPAEIKISLGRVAYKAHRLAWLIATGDDPGELTTDHIDRNPFNNKLSNLRLASRSLQSENRSGYGTSTHKGVSFYKSRQKWEAYCRVDGKRFRLGYFSTEGEAAAVAALYYTH